MIKRIKESQIVTRKATDDDYKKITSFLSKAVDNKELRDIIRNELAAKEKTAFIAMHKHFIVALMTYSIDDSNYIEITDIIADPLLEEYGVLSIICDRFKIFLKDEMNVSDVSLPYPSFAEFLAQIDEQEKKEQQKEDSDSQSEKEKQDSKKHSKNTDPSKEKQKKTNDKTEKSEKTKNNKKQNTASDSKQTKQEDLDDAQNALKEIQGHRSYSNGEDPTNNLLKHIDQLLEDDPLKQKSGNQSVDEMLQRINDTAKRARDRIGAQRDITVVSVSGEKGDVSITHKDSSDFTVVDEFSRFSDDDDFEPYEEFNALHEDFNDDYDSMHSGLAPYQQNYDEGYNNAVDEFDGIDEEPDNIVSANDENENIPVNDEQIQPEEEMVEKVIGTDDFGNPIYGLVPKNQVVIGTDDFGNPIYGIAEDSSDTQDYSTDYNDNYESDYEVQQSDFTQGDYSDSYDEYNNQENDYIAYERVDNQPEYSDYYNSHYDNHKHPSRPHQQKHQDYRYDYQNSVRYPKNEDQPYYYDDEDTHNDYYDNSQEYGYYDNQPITNMGNNKNPIDDILNNFDKDDTPIEAPNGELRARNFDAIFPSIGEDNSSSKDNKTKKKEPSTKRPRKKLNLGRVAVLTVLVFAIAVGTGSGYILLTQNNNNTPNGILPERTPAEILASDNKVSITITADDTAETISQALYNAGLTEQAYSFLDRAKQQDGSTDKTGIFNTGTYEVNLDSNGDAIYTQVKSGVTRPTAQIIIQAGMTIDDIANTVANVSNGSIDALAFKAAMVRAIVNGGYSMIYGVEEPIPENVAQYIIAGEYMYEDGTNAEEFAHMLIQKMQDTYISYGKGQREFKAALDKATFIEQHAQYDTDKQMLSGVLDSNPALLMNEIITSISEYDLFAAMNPSVSEAQNFIINPDGHLAFE